MKKNLNREMQKIHSVKYNFLMNFILSASQIVFPLITSPYIFRVLSPAGNGKIAFAASVANYFMMIACLGIPTYGVRACAAVRDDKYKLSKTAQEIFFINLVATTISMIVYIACILYVPRFSSDRILFYINGVNIVLNTFGMNWFFQAIEQYDYITYRSLLFKAISVILMFALVHKPSDYIVYGAITIFAGVGSNILNFIRITHLIEFQSHSNYDLKKHIKPIFVLFAESIAISVYSSLDVIMLGFLKSDVEVGYYNIALKLKNLLLVLVSSLGNVLLPRMSYYYKNDLQKQFNDTLVKSLNFTLMLSLPITLFFVLNSRASVLFLGGNEYLQAVLTMQILLLAIIPNSLSGVTGVQVLTPMEKEKIVLYSVMAGAFVDFVLNLIFIPKMGASGVALATALTELIVLAIQLYYIKEYISIVISRLRIPVYLIGIILACIPTLLLKRIVFSSVFIELLVNAVVFFVIYGVVLLVGKEEMILQVLNEMKKILDRAVRRIDDDLINKVFVLFFGLFVFASTFSLTMYSIENESSMFVQIMKLIRYVTYVWCFFVIGYNFKTKKYSINSLIAYSIILIVFILNFINTGQRGFLMNFILFFALYKIKSEKLIKASSYIQLAVLFVTIILAESGLITNEITVIRNRDMLGFGWASYPAFLFFFVFSLYSISRKEQLTIIELGIALLINIFIYIKTDTKSPFALTSIYILCCLILKYKQEIKDYVFKNKIFKNAKYLPYFCAIFSLFIVLYNRNELWHMINKLTSGRLVLGSDGVYKYGISLFGQRVLLVADPNNYNYVDSAYLSMAIKDGIVTLSILLKIYEEFIKKSLRQKNIYLLLSLCFIVFLGIFDPWLYSASMNVFPFLAFCDLFPYENNRKLKKIGMCIISNINHYYDKIKQKCNKKNNSK